MARRFELSDEVQDIREDLGRLRTDLSEIVEALIAGGRSGASELSDRIAHTASKWASQFRHRMSDAGTRGRDTLHVIGGQIEERPLTSLLIAFGVGMVIGKLLDRRS